MPGRVRFTLVVLVALALLPLTGLVAEDSVPLSSYPMFSEPRPRTVTVAHVVGVRADGRHEPLPPRALGTREVLTARAVATAAAADPALARRLCRETTARMTPGAYEAVAVRVDRYDAIAYFAGAREPIDGREVARCMP